MILATGSSSISFSEDDTQGSGQRSAGSIIESSERREVAAPVIFTAGMVILEAKKVVLDHEQATRRFSILAGNFSQAFSHYTSCKSDPARKCNSKRAIAHLEQTEVDSVLLRKGWDVILTLQRTLASKPSGSLDQVLMKQQPTMLRLGCDSGLCWSRDHLI